MVRTSLVSLLVLSVGCMVAGCPTDVAGGSLASIFSTLGNSATSTPNVTDTQVVAPASAVAGERVTLEATLVTDGDISAASYRWFQTSGRVIELLDAESRVASFVAPSLDAVAALSFRVDVTIGRSTTSAAARVQIGADPNFGIDPNANSGGGDSSDPFPQVRLTTSMGEIVVELNRDKAPISTENFLKYVDARFYNGTIFHRVIRDFVVQGGGFESGLTQKSVRSPIVNESTNGLRNLRGTLAMARTNAPNSATAQFYVNLVDNSSLDRTASNPGYAVFGRVIVGMKVIDEIAKVETGSQNGFDDVPLDDVTLTRAERTSGVTPE